MNLTEYRRTATRLADFLPWAALAGEGVVLNKDGSFQRTARFRGPDLDSAVPAELVAVAATDDDLGVSGQEHHVARALADLDVAQAVAPGVEHLQLVRFLVGDVDPVRHARGLCRQGGCQGGQCQQGRGPCSQVGGPRVQRTCHEDVSGGLAGAGHAPQGVSQKVLQGGTGVCRRQRAAGAFMPVLLRAYKFRAWLRA